MISIIACMSSDYLVGGFNPFENNMSQNGFIFPRVRVENEKYLSCHHPVMYNWQLLPFFSMQSVYLLVAVLAHRWRGIKATIDDCLAKVGPFRCWEFSGDFCFVSHLEQREVDFKKFRCWKFQLWFNYHDIDSLWFLTWILQYNLICFFLLLNFQVF